MKTLGFALLFTLFSTLLLAAEGLHFEITDARGRQTSSVTIAAGDPDADGWHPLTVKSKGKGEPVLVWPFDGLAKLPDGPEPIPAIVIQRGDPKALVNKPAIAAMATPVVLGRSTLEEEAGKAGYTVDSLGKAFSTLSSSTDPFEKGVGLLYSGKTGDAAGELAIALRQRQRQLTRVPSEIYPAALLYGQALYRANKFDDAAVAFRAALDERPSDRAARKQRSDALVKAGKPEAAEQ